MVVNSLKPVFVHWHGSPKPVEKTGSSFTSGDGSVVGRVGSRACASGWHGDGTPLRVSDGRVCVVKIKVLTVMALLVSLCLMAGVEPAAAAELNVRVTIERVREIRGFGLGDDPDFYAEVSIDGETFDNKNTPEQDEQEGDD